MGTSVVWHCSSQAHLRWALTSCATGLQSPTSAQNIQNTAGTWSHTARMTSPCDTTAANRTTPPTNPHIPNLPGDHGNTGDDLKCYLTSRLIGRKNVVWHCIFKYETFLKSKSPAFTQNGRNKRGSSSCQFRIITCNAETMESLNSVIVPRKYDKKWFTADGIIDNRFTILLWDVLAQ